MNLNEIFLQMFCEIKICVFVSIIKLELQLFINILETEYKQKQYELSFGKY